MLNLAVSTKNKSNKPVNQITFLSFTDICVKCFSSGCLMRLNLQRLCGES